MSDKQVSTFHIKTADTGYAGENAAGVRYRSALPLQAATCNSDSCHPLQQLCLRQASTGIALLQAQ